jgi:hypothetical protein
MATQRRLVTLAKTHPKEPERADEILVELAKHVSVLTAVDPKPDDPFVSIDAGEGVNFEEAGRRVLVLLNEIAEDWPEHLRLVEPQPSSD